MTGTQADLDVERRRYLKAAAAAGVLGTSALAGCTDGDGGDGDGGDSDGGDDGGGSMGTLEVLHGWTGGDGEQAVNNLESTFEEEHPDIDRDFNPIGGGGNQDLDQVVANRFQSNDPPSLFAGWPGPNLVQYEGVLGDVEDLWDDEGFKDAHADEVVEACEGPDGFSAVPIGSHRMNDLFYNVSVLEEAGVDPDSDIESFDDWLDAMDTVASETDATPYVNTLADWTNLQFWAVTMLSTQGYDAYMNFIEGDGDRDAVLSAFQRAEEVLSEYINADAAEVEFTQANQRLMNGEAAFTHQGNWVAGAYISEGLEYGEDWDRIQFPGTENMYGLHFDSFIYPADNPTPEASQTFLRFAGSEEAQIAFNQYKGSIPTREVDTSEFSEYLVETIEDFENAEHRPPTIAHGLAVTQPVQTELQDIVATNFADPFDAEAATDEFMDAV